MPGVTWWKLTNSIMVRRAGRKPTFARPAASVSLGSVLSCGNAAQTSILTRSECRLPFLLSDPIARAAKVRNPPKA